MNVRKLLYQMKFVEWVFFAILIMVPLGFDYWGFDMYEVTKNVILRLGVGLLAIGFGLEILRKKNFRWYKSKEIYWFVGGLIFLLLVSLLTSVHPLTSFVGTYYRQAGVVNFGLYILLFLFGIQIFRDSKNQKRLLNVIAYTGLVVSIYAILQKFGVDVFQRETTDVFAGRSFSFMGNPTSLGAYLIFPFWVFILKIKNSLKDSDWLAWNTISLLIVILAIFYTQNRSTILGLLVIGGLVLAYYMRKRWKVLLLSLFALAILSVGFINYYDGDLRSLKSRLIIWESSLNIVKEQPILGTGAESFALRFENHVPKEFFEYEDYLHLADRPHNEPLEWWINFGILGLAFYLILVGALVSKFFETKDVKVQLMIAAMLSLFVSNLFSFSWTVHYVILAVMLAYVFVGTAKSTEIKRWKIRMISCFVLGLGLLIWGTSLLIVNHKLRLALVDVIDADIDGVVMNTEQVLALGSYYYDVQTEAFNNYYVLFPFVEEKDLLSPAALANDKAKELNGYRLRTILNDARVLIDLGEFEAAEEIFENLYYSKSPNPLVYQKWGDMYFEQNQFVKAVEVYEEMLGLMPSHWRSPLLSGDLTERERIFWKNHADFTEVLDRIMFSYIAVGREDDAKKLIELVR